MQGTPHTKHTITRTAQWHKVSKYTSILQYSIRRIQTYIRDTLGRRQIYRSLDIVTEDVKRLRGAQVVLISVTSSAKTCIMEEQTMSF